MGYVLKHPNNSSESLIAIAHLKSTSECIFEYTRSDPRLMPILFNFHANLDHEQDYHCFVIEIVCGCWAILRLRQYLWWTLFYWLYDCNAIIDILEYNDSIQQLKWWSKEILAYEFVIIHCLAATMQDVDGVSRYIDPLLHQYIITASRLHTEDVIIRPFSYSFDVFIRCNNPRHVTASNALSVSITKSSIPSIPTLYYTPIKFSVVFNLGSVPTIPDQDTECHVLPIPVSPP